MGIRAGVGVTALVAMLLGLSMEPARAQAGDSPGAAAFEEALQAYDRKQYDIACPGFLRSYELDPTMVGVPHTLAECYTKTGKVASAVAWFRTYLKVAGALPADLKEGHRRRIKRSEEQLAALTSNVPVVTVVVRGAGALNARVLLDDKELVEASLKEPQPIDPGAHRVTVTSTDGVTAERAFMIALGEKKSIDLEVQTKGSAATTSASPEPDAGMSGQRIGAIAAFGVGAAGLIVMGITGGIVLGNKDAVRETCPADSNGVGRCETAEDENLGNKMYTLGMVSNVSLGVGLAAAALGTVLLLTEPKDNTKRAGSPRWIALGPTRIDREAVILGAAGAF